MLGPKPYTLAFCHTKSDWWLQEKLAAQNTIYIDPSERRPSTLHMDAEEFVYNVLERIPGVPLKDVYFVVCPKTVYTAELLVAVWRKLRKGGRMIIAHPDADAVWPDHPKYILLPDVPMERPTSFNNAMHAFWQHTGIPVYRPDELMDNRRVFIMKK